MKSFSTIQAAAAERKGGPKALQQLLPAVPSKEALAQKGDDRFLAMMCKAINQAGFNWTVIENKWPQFEEAFYGFDVPKLAHMPVELWESYTQDKRVVRNWTKIKALMHNSQFVDRTALAHGSFAQFIANWPVTDQIGLMAHLKKHGSRLGGQTALWFLRYVGKDCFVLSQDVVKAIQFAGIDVNDKPTSKRDLTQIQQAFNTWHEQTGWPMTHLSKTLAYSCGNNYDNETMITQMDKFSAGSV